MVARPPLTPANCDLRDFPRMMIDITRLRQSEFDASINDAAWRAGLNLWFSAWHSVPSGSLSSDDASLAKAAGLGRDVRTWKKVQAEALRGFIECSDGRIYHDTVSEFALEAWLEKLVQRLSSGAGNAKRWGIDFDPAEIENEIDCAAEMLSALNPQSKSIQKAKRRHSRRDADGNPTGNKNKSHRDEETIPSGSQGTGTEERKKGSVDKSTGETPVEDPVKALFDLGVSILASAGQSEKEARAMVGKWRRDQGDAATSEALLSARDKTDPLGWIQARFAQAQRQTNDLYSAIDRKYGAPKVAVAGQ